MPVMNGIQMVTRYRIWEKEQEDRGTKQYIVGISANADGSDIEEGKRQGVYECEEDPTSPRAPPTRGAPPSSVLFVRLGRDSRWTTRRR